MTENPAQPDEKLSKYALTLIRRLLTIADEDFTEVSYQDREWLEEALSGTSIKVIARHQKLSSESIRQHIIAALDKLSRKISDWEDWQNEIEQLREERLRNIAKIAELTQIVEKLKIENNYQRSVLDVLDGQKPKNVQKRLLDEKTRKLIMKPLRGIGIPPHIAKKFADNNIHIVLELLRHTDHELSRLDGVSDYAVELIQRVLKFHGLHLNSNIRWSPDEDAYYIYSSDNKNMK